MTRITLVRKIKADGTPCRKCVQVDEHLERDGAMRAIDRVVTADERDPHSEGMRLAALHGVDRAPFFIVEDPRGTQVYTVYFRFRSEVLRARGAARAPAARPGALQPEPGRV